MSSEEPFDDAIQRVRDRLRDGPKRLQGGFLQISSYKSPCRTNMLIRVSWRLCRDFCERSGAGVEPTQPGAARPHRF
jgi:hypothetical protein